MSGDEDNEKSIPVLRNAFELKPIARNLIIALSSTFLNILLIQPLYSVSAQPPDSVVVSANSESQGNILVPASSLKDPTRPKGEPSAEAVNLAKDAFRYFDDKQLQLSEKKFSEAIDVWEKINRPLDEIASLYKARGNVRTDLKMFDKAINDYNVVIKIEEDDGARNKDGTAKYFEFPDTYVQRGLANEGLAKWEDAIGDYSEAIKLWGGGRGPEINPYVLTFRGNALAYLNRYEEALNDYEAADVIFTERRSFDRAIDVRANRALALYEVGKREESVKLMRDIIRKQPGYADLHIALAADAWQQRDGLEAEKEWEYACNNIQVGCSKYKDPKWVRGVRRWPPSLANQLSNFLNRKI